MASLRRWHGWRMYLGLSLTAVLSACGGSNAFSGIVAPSTPPSEQTSVTQVQMAPDTLHFSDTGQSSQISATPVDSAGNPVSGLTLTWSSSDAGVATVGTDGTVTSAGAGTATVTAAVGNIKGTTVVVVTTPSGVSPLG